MNIPPDNEMKACLEVIQLALLRSRAWGWQDNIDAQQLADLMDATHNIPSIVQRWKPDSSEEILSMLEAYDNRWSQSDVNSLKACYEEFATST